MGKNKQFACLVAVLGAGEARTEEYLTYFEGAPEPATTHSAKSARGVFGSAGKQASVAGKL